MQRLRTFLKEYFNFGKRDRFGVLALIALIGLIYTLPYLFAKKNESLTARQTEIFIKADDTLVEKQQRKEQSDFEGDYYEYQYQPSQSKSFEWGELFQFDPNTLPVEGWQRLGLTEKTSKTIDKYRNKGGKFYKPEDIQKIWGLPDGFYDRVKDYIHISPSNRNQQASDFNKTIYTEAGRKAIVVDINEADTSALIALPGIGSKLAARIVNFRDRLGGFYSVDQIRETYGLPDSTFQKIKSSFQLSGAVKKFNINTVTKEELKVHPYFKWNLANAIVEYRNQHGPFKSLDELKNIAAIDEATFQKILPYLGL